MTNADRPVPVDRYVQELDNIMSVELHRNGNQPKVVIYEAAGRRYLVESYLFDITDDPFYQKRGLQERLDKRAASEDAES